MLAFFIMLFLGTRGSPVYMAMGYYTPLAFSGSVVYALPCTLLAIWLLSTDKWKSVYRLHAVLIALLTAFLGSILLFCMDYRNVHSSRIGCLLATCGCSLMLPSLWKAPTKLCIRSTSRVLYIDIALACALAALGFLLEKVIHFSVAPIYITVAGIVALRSSRLAETQHVPNTKEASHGRRAMTLALSLSCGLIARSALDWTTRAALNASSILPEQIAFLSIGLGAGIALVECFSSKSVYLYLASVAMTASLIIFTMLGYQISNITHLLSLSLSAALFVILTIASMIEIRSVQHREEVPVTQPVDYCIKQLLFLIGFLFVPSLEFLFTLALSNNALMGFPLELMTILPIIIIVANAAILLVREKAASQRALWVDKNNERMLAKAIQKWNLTARETDVISELASGRTAGKIAERLSVSINTVRSHIKSIYAKMGIHSQQELIDIIDKLATECRKRP